MDKVRVDKWLWAARFYKTRSIAKQAIEGGKVHINNQRVKASKDLEVGTILTLRQGWDIKEVEVISLSDQRRNATEAAKLYRETEESIEKRRIEAEQRKAMNTGELRPPGKPNTRQRRHIHRFKREILDDK